MSNEAIRWRICEVCGGDEKIDPLGVVDIDDFSPEEREAYFAGRYRVNCPHCRGTGKVPADKPQAIIRPGSNGQPVVYQDADDASEHFLRMQEGLC